MKFEFLDLTNKWRDVLVSHGVPRVGDNVVVQVDPIHGYEHRLYKVTRVVWFTRSDLDPDEWSKVSIPSVEGEEIPKEVNYD